MVAEKGRLQTGFQSRIGLDSLAESSLLWAIYWLVLGVVMIANIGILGWSVWQIFRASVDYINHT